MKEYSSKKCEEICGKPEKEFSEIKGMQKITVSGRYYFFQDNGADILAVGHLDSVQPYTHFCDDKSVIFCPTLDDRLGVYIILDMLPKLGVNVDVLLCTDEEKGASTAALFTTKKKYKWLVEFDRMGEDVALYQYDDDKGPWNTALQKAGFKTARGSYSDIAYLENLGVKAFNVGIGYKEYHTFTSHAFKDVMFRQIKRFLAFYEENRNIEYKHEKKKVKTFVDTRSHYGTYSHYRDYYDPAPKICVFCDKKPVDDTIGYICTSCAEKIEKTLEEYYESKNNP